MQQRSDHSDERRVMKKYNTVIFDLDGTLLNTLEDMQSSMNYVLAAHGFPQRTLAEIRSFVGNGIGRLTELSVPSGKNNPAYEDCLNEYRQHYAANMMNKTAVYLGIYELLGVLKDSGHKLAIVSNKFDSAVKELNRVYFSEYIYIAIGSSDDVARKPAPDTLIKAMRELGADKEQTVYVGDSDVDVNTAKNAGVVSVGVTWGFRGREVLEAHGADFVIDSPQELLAILD